MTEQLTKSEIKTLIEVHSENTKHLTTIADLLKDISLKQNRQCIEINDIKIMLIKIMAGVSILTPIIYSIINKIIGVVENG